MSDEREELSGRSLDEHQTPEADRESEDMPDVRHAGDAFVFIEPADPSDPAPEEADGGGQVSW